MKLHIACASAALLISGLAVAKTDPKVTAAETAMMDACKKEFRKETAGKKLDDVAEWVEEQEHQADEAKAAKFKESKCFDRHEKWERVANKEEDEKHK